MAASLGGLLLAMPAAAQEAAPDAAEDAADDDVRWVTISISGLQLARVGGEGTLEVRLTETFSIAGVGGARFATIKPEGRWYVAGGMFRYYAWGNFNEGLHFGAELLWVGADDVADRLEPSPMLGYKMRTESGFTFDAQIGPLFSVPLQSGEDESFEVGLNLNPNFGFTF